VRGEPSKNPSTSGNISSSTHSDLRGGEADHSIPSEDILNTDNTGGSNKTTRAEATIMWGNTLPSMESLNHLESKNLHTTYLIFHWECVRRIGPITTKMYGQERPLNTILDLRWLRLIFRW